MGYYAVGNRMYGAPPTGYLPIEEHGIVGDLRTVARVGTDGPPLTVFAVRGLRPAHRAAPHLPQLANSPQRKPSRPAGQRPATPSVWVFRPLFGRADHTVASCFGYFCRPGGRYLPNGRSVPDA